MTTDTKFVPILERVRNLMARAEHPDTPAPEAEVALREANKLMTRHAIDEAILASTQTKAQRRAPVVEKWVWMESYSEHTAYLRSMLGAIAAANRCRIVVSLRAPYEVTVIGMREDADWVQTLYTSCHLAFLSRLSPRFDVNDLDGSIYRYKVAGHTWIETWWAMVDALDLRDKVAVSYHRYPYPPRTDKLSLAAMKEAGIPLRPPVEGKTSSFIAAYRRHADKIGDTELISTQHTKAYRRSFAKGFADRIAQRLWRMRRDSEQMVASEGAELVLAGVEEAVADAYYGEFPQFHPDAVKEREVATAEASAEAQRQAERAEELKMAAMTPSARARYIEAKERKERRERESNERYWAKQDARVTYISSAARAGSDAADTVELSRSTAVKDESGVARLRA